MMKANEIPQKKDINRKLMDTVIDESVTEGSFKIVVSHEDKSTEVEFKKYISALDLRVFLDESYPIGCKQDPNNGSMYLDDIGLELSTHTFIMQAFSTMPTLLHGKGDEAALDIKAIAAYGAYFASVSQEYLDMFNELYQKAIDACEERISNHNNMMRAFLSGPNAASMLQSPEMISGVMDVLKDKLPEFASALADAETE